MQRKRIERRKVIGYNGVSGNLPRFWDQVHRRSGQCRHVQRLANVANGIRSAIVMVQKAATTHKIQQRQANQRCANPAQFFSGQTCTEFSHISVIKIH